MKRIRLFCSIAALTLCFGSSLMAQSDDHGGRPLSTVLKGAAEVPGPGDTDGGGTAKITLNHGQGQICFELTVSNIAAATAAHIHDGVEGKAGPPVVTLTAPASGSSKDCVNADKELIKKIMDNPGNYYVNVHNAEFPDGAIRGQLSKGKDTPES